MKLEAKFGFGVLYNEQGRHDGLTALQVQRKVGGEGTRKDEGLGVK